MAYIMTGLLSQLEKIHVCAVKENNHNYQSRNYSIIIFEKKKTPKYLNRYFYLKNNIIFFCSFGVFFFEHAQIQPHLSWTFFLIYNFSTFQVYPKRFLLKEISPLLNLKLSCEFYIPLG